MMENNDLTELTNKELEESKKIKRNRIMYALLIGFLIGIVLYSVVKNTWGFFTLIPLYFIYRLVNKSNEKEDDDM
jgi:hypothetical protein